MHHCQIQCNFGCIDDLCQLGKEYLTALTCKLCSSFLTKFWNFWHTKCLSIISRCSYLISKTVWFYFLAQPVERIAFVSLASVCNCEEVLDSWQKALFCLCHCQLSNRDHTQTVIRNALLKYGTAGRPSEFSLFQLLPDRSGMWLILEPVSVCPVMCHVIMLFPSFSPLPVPSYFSAAPCCARCAPCTVLNTAVTFVIVRHSSSFLACNSYDCIAPYVDIILHRGRFFAKSAASESVRWCCFRSCWTVLSHVMRGRPSCFLQSAGGEANRILLASALSSMCIICPNRVSRRGWIIALSLGCFVSLLTLPRANVKQNVNILATGK